MQHSTTKRCNFTKFTMLDAYDDSMVIFLPVSNFFKISSKRLNLQDAVLRSMFFLIFY